MPRIDPLEPPYDAEAGEQLRAMMPPGMPPIALFRAFAKNLPMTRAMRGWGSYELSKELSLSLREREIVIDRTCARCGCEYEWGVHVTSFGQALSIPKEQLRATATQPATSDVWTERQKLLIQLVDELHETSTVSDTLWQQLAASWNETQLIELLVLVGWYHTI